MNQITKISLIVLLISLSVYSAHSQPAIFGVNIGGNMSYHNISGPQNENTQSREGFSLGTFLDINVGKYFKITPEINFVLKGSKIQHSDENNLVTEIPTKLYYGSFPINGKLGLNLNSKLFAFVLAGLRVDVLIDENENGLNGLYKNRNIVNYGACIGLGLTYYRNKRSLFGVELRYNPDFNSFSVDKYTYAGVTTNFASETKFRNESLELLLKIGFR